MKHQYLCDVAGAVAVIGLIVALSVVGLGDNIVPYVGLLGLGAYAYVSFEFIPKRQAKRLAVAYREVPAPPVPIPSGVEHVPAVSDRRRSALHRVAA